MIEINKLKDEICEAGLGLYKFGLIAGYEGNISCRVHKTDQRRLTRTKQKSADTFLITPAGCCKGDLRKQDLLLVDASGNCLAKQGLISTEFLLHMAVYQEEPETLAVIHAHPPISTAYAATGLTPGIDLLPESTNLFGTLPTAPYAKAGSPELADSVRGLVRANNAVLLANHGVLCYSKISLMDAMHLTQQLEQISKISLAAHQLGSHK
jgi:L-fuculose-phosphate aldolase